MVVVVMSCLMGAAAATETDWDLVIPDALWRESKTDWAAMLGYCSRKFSYQSPPLGITVWNADDYKFTGHRFDFITSRGEAGHTVVEVRGVPYGPFAFQKRTGNMYVVPRGKEVFLVDLRLAVRARRRSGDDFEECLARLGRRGSVALVLCEKVENYRSAVRSAAELHFDLPVLCIDDPNGKFRAMRTLQRTRNTLRHSKKDTSSPVFITDDITLARLADGEKFPTYFIGSRNDMPGWKPKIMRQFDSFGELKESLATGPAGD